VSPRAVAAALALALALPGASVAAGGAERRGPIAELLARARAELDAAAAARVPPLVPPKRVTVRWRARRIATIDLKAPLLALRAGDVDGDGTAELVALTTRELIVGRVVKSKVEVVARAALPADVPPARPRDPVGTLVLAREPASSVTEIWARSSESARGVALAMRAGNVEELRQLDGFPLCAGASAQLGAGRNFFLATQTTWQAPAPALPASYYAVTCAGGMVDPEGRPLRAMAALSTDGTLAVRVERSCRPDDSVCLANPSIETTVSGVGTAYVIADVDNDGRPELISASDRPPGDPDRVTVRSPSGSLWKQVYQRGFSGGVAGVAAGDLDGDGDIDVVAAVRLIGSDRVDLWALD